MVTTPVSDTWGHDLSGERGSVVVIGLGYIGLPTAVVLAHNGWDVTGVDVGFGDSSERSCRQAAVP